jgi:hypothetical protein
MGAIVAMITAGVVACDMAEAPELREIRTNGFRCSGMLQDVPLVVDVPPGQQGDSIGAISATPVSQSLFTCHPQDRTVILGCEPASANASQSRFSISVANHELVGQLRTEGENWSMTVSCGRLAADAGP